MKLLTPLKFLGSKNVRNKTIIGLKYDTWKAISEKFIVRNKTIIGLKYVIVIITHLFVLLEIRL